MAVIHPAALDQPRRTGGLSHRSPQNWSGGFYRKQLKQTVRAVQIEALCSCAGGLGARDGRGVKTRRVVTIWPAGPSLEPAGPSLESEMVSDCRLCVKFVTLRNPVVALS